MCGQCRPVPPPGKSLGTAAGMAFASRQGRELSTPGLKAPTAPPGPAATPCQAGWWAPLRPLGPFGPSGPFGFLLRLPGRGSAWARPALGGLGSGSAEGPGHVSLPCRLAAARGTAGPPDWQRGAVVSSEASFAPSPPGPPGHARGSLTGGAVGVAAARRAPHALTAAPCNNTLREPSRRRAPSAGSP